MYDDDQCKNLTNVAYRSCLDIFLTKKDKKEIEQYCFYLLNAKRYCEAKGVEKALEFIDLYNHLYGEEEYL